MFTARKLVYGRTWCSRSLTGAVEREMLVFEACTLCRYFSLCQVMRGS